MTSEEIAKWMGITYGSFRKNPEKRLELLESHASFEKVYGGFIIKEIYVPVYDKTLNKKDDEKYLQEIRNCQDGLSTLSGMARKFKAYDEDYKNLTERQIKRRMTASGKRLFGETKDLTAMGLAGSREYLWAIKLDNFNHYRLLTEEEEERFNNIISSLYATDPERIKKAALLEEKFLKSDMSKEEYITQKERENLCIFKDCIFQFKDETGFMIVHCTKHQLLQEFKISAEDRAKLAESN